MEMIRTGHWRWIAHSLLYFQLPAKECGLSWLRAQERCRSPQGVAGERAPLDQRLRVAAQAAALRGGAMPGSGARSQDNQTGAGLGEALGGLTRAGASSLAAARVAELGEPKARGVVGSGSVSGLGTDDQGRVVLPRWVRAARRAGAGGRAGGANRVQVVSGQGFQVLDAGARGKPQADGAAHGQRGDGRASGAQRAAAGSTEDSGNTVIEVDPTGTDVFEVAASDWGGAGQSGAGSTTQPASGAAAAAAAAGGARKGSARRSGVGAEAGAGGNTGLAGGAGQRPEDAPLRVFVGVLTAAANARARAAIRATWGADMRLHRRVHWAERLPGYKHWLNLSWPADKALHKGPLKPLPSS